MPKCTKCNDDGHYGGHAGDDDLGARAICDCPAGEALSATAPPRREIGLKEALAKAKADGAIPMPPHPDQPPRQATPVLLRAPVTVQVQAPNGETVTFEVTVIDGGLRVRASGDGDSRLDVLRAEGDVAVVTPQQEQGLQIARLQGSLAYIRDAIIAADIPHLSKYGFLRRWAERSESDGQVDR